MMKKIDDSADGEPGTPAARARATDDRFHVVEGKERGSGIAVTADEKPVSRIHVKMSARRHPILHADDALLASHARFGIGRSRVHGYRLATNERAHAEPDQGATPGLMGAWIREDPKAAVDGRERSCGGSSLDRTTNATAPAAEPASAPARTRIGTSSRTRIGTRIRHRRPRRSRAASRRADRRHEKGPERLRRAAPFTLYAAAGTATAASTAAATATGTGTGTTGASARRRTAARLRHPMRSAFRPIANWTCIVRGWVRSTRPRPNVGWSITSPGS